MIETLAGWILTIALQGALLLAAAWAADRLLRNTRAAWRELLWRAALFGAVAIATLQAAFVSSAAPHHFVVPTSASASNPSVEIAAPRSEVPVASIAPKAATQTIQADVVAASWRPAFSFPTIDWPRVVVVAWLLGALVAFARLLNQGLRLRRLVRSSEPLVDTRIDAAATVIAADLDIAEPRLFELPHLPSPMATFGRRIVIPSWAVHELDAPHLRVMLAHEMAHLARRDPEWKLAGALWSSVFWFVPFAWIARHRLDDLAELACDALAAQHTQDHRALAECLVACAEHRQRGFTPALASAMAARPSPLMHRIERLLEGIAMETRLSPVTRGIAAVAIGLCVFALPIVGFDPLSGAAHAAGKSSSVSIHSDDGHSTMQISLDDGQTKLFADVDGNITFNADDTDIASLDAGGHARFEETRDGTKRRVDFVNHDGKFQPTFSINGTEQPYDATAQAWFAGLLPALIRESALGAEARVKRLYAAGGAGRVIDEIEKTHSEYARGVYLDALLHLAKFSGAELDRLVQAAGAIDSDYERRKALTAVIDTQTLAPAQQPMFLKQAQKFSSDYERAELLIAALPKFSRTDETYAVWLDAANGVHSDYEHRRCLQALVDRGGATDADLLRVIQASETLNSDYEHRELLVSTATRAKDPNAIAVAYAAAAQKIHSDYEHREALVALIRRGALNVASTDAVLDSAAQIGSYNDCLEVLMATARAMPDDPALVAHYRRVAQRLSEYERERAERFLTRTTN